MATSGPLLSVHKGECTDMGLRCSFPTTPAQLNSFSAIFLLYVVTPQYYPKGSVLAVNDPNEVVQRK